MIRLLRFSPSRLGLGYIALSVLALALFAVPLWSAWRVNLGTFRAYVQGEDVQRLVDVFDREGAKGLAAAMESQVRDLPGDEIMILADASKSRLAGNLPAWPPQVPDAPGTYGLVIDIGGGATMRVVALHAKLPGGYHLLRGRESVLFQSFIERFWYGIAGAVTIVLVMGAGIGWLIHRALLAEVNEISRTASAIAEGDLSRRLAASSGSPELDTLARTVNDMVAQLARQNVQLEDEIAVRRQAEQALHRAHDELEGVVAQRTGELARANESLRLSEERYARALDASDEGHWELNVSTGEIFVSARMKQIFGLAADTRFPDHAEYVARAPFYPDDRQRVLGTFQSLLSGESERYEMEYRIVPQPGEIRWVRSRAKAFRDERGVTTRMSGSLTDITDRKRAQEALQASEERHRAVVESQTELVCRYLPDTTLTFANEAYCRFFGRRREELIGRSFLEVIPEPAWPAVLNQVASLVKDPRVCTYEHEVVRADGTTGWQQWVDSPVVGSDGHVVELQGIGRDITDRKAAEDESRLRKEELQRLMDSISDYLWSAEVAVDGSFAYRYYSPVVERITGRPPEYFLESPERWLGTIHPLDRPLLAEAFQRITSGATDREDAEYRILRPDGALRWVRDSMRATRVEDGRILLDGVVSDITDRKLAAEALRESEARFRNLTELSSDWYWKQDENLRFTYLSSQASDLTGYPGESSYGKTRWELASTTPLSCSWPEHRAVLAARQPFRDLEMRRVVGPDGTVRYFSVSGTPIFDEEGRFNGYHGIGRDITERKRIEEELRARQDMLDLAQKAARAVAFEWRIGAGEGENRWSPDIEAMYGLAPGSYDGTYDTWKKLVFPEDWPAVKAAIQRANETGDVAAEYRVVHPDGAVHWLQAKGRMFFDDEGKPTRMVGFMLDVTERHQAEEELRRLERQLRQAQRLEAMGTLAGGIAHDFNNILGAILGYGEMALRDAAKGSRLRRDLDSIMTAGERGRALVDRVLAFSRSGVGERVPVHVERVAREALDQLAASLPADVTIAPRLHAGRAAVLGDPTQVHQVLMNLATNAIQAMVAGGTMRVSLDEVRLDAPRVATTGTLDSGEYVVLAVADSGTGIPPEIMERIFDPFFTTKEVGVGTGLGLSLVHSIVTELGGAIDVASKPGAGSVFTVYLPRAGDAADSQEREEPEAPRGNSQQVLIVDDEAPLVRLATETLAELGYVAVGFTSSAAALEAFRAAPERFDAVITDERMPGMSGSALIREIRGIRSAIPILLVSGYVAGDVVAPRAGRRRRRSAEEAAFCARACKQPRARAWRVADAALFAPRARAQTVRGANRSVARRGVGHRATAQGGARRGHAGQVGGHAHPYAVAPGRDECRHGRSRPARQPLVRHTAQRRQPSIPGRQPGHRPRRRQPARADTGVHRLRRRSGCRAVACQACPAQSDCGAGAGPRVRAAPRPGRNPRACGRAAAAA